MLPQIAGLQDSFARIDKTYEENYSAVRMTLGALAVRCTRAWHLNRLVEAEHALNQVTPELIVAATGLTRSLDKLDGWRIAWQSIEHGPSVRYERVRSANGTYLHVPVLQGPLTYAAHDGWIIGSRVGPDDGLSEFGAWIEVGSLPFAARGTYVSMRDMFEIDITAPDVISDAAITGG